MRRYVVEGVQVNPELPYSTRDSVLAGSEEEAEAIVLKLRNWEGTWRAEYVTSMEEYAAEEMARVSKMAAMSLVDVEREWRQTVEVLGGAAEGVEA